MRFFLRHSVGRGQPKLNEGRFEAMCNLGDGNCVRANVASVHPDACRASRNKQRHGHLDRPGHEGNIERHKQDQNQQGRNLSDDVRHDTLMSHNTLEAKLGGNFRCQHRSRAIHCQVVVFGGVQSLCQL